MIFPTDKEHEALKFIEHCYAVEGYFPTINEVASYMGYRCVNSGAQIFKQLVRKGFLAKKNCHYILGRFK